MSKTKSLSSLLVDSSMKTPAKNPADSAPPDFINDLLHHPSKDAANIVSQHYEYVFLAQRASEIEVLKSQAAELDVQYRSSLEQLHKLETKKIKTQQYIKSEEFAVSRYEDSGKEDKK